VAIMTRMFTTSVANLHRSRHGFSTLTVSDNRRQQRSPFVVRETELANQRASTLAI
jgi:hypothetical protein